MLLQGFITLGGMVISGYGASVFTRKKYEVEVLKMKEELKSASIANVESKIKVYEHIIDRLEERCHKLEQQVDELTEKLHKANEFIDKLSTLNNGNN